MTVELRLVPVDHPDVAAMTADVQVEYVRRYGGQDDSPMDPTSFDAPGGAFFLGYLGDEPVAMGGWRFRLDVQALGGNAVAEVKRMFVEPAARRRGFARQVLDHLETSAHQAGADVMVLETGIEQPEAIALYEAVGYVPIEKFGHYAWSPRSRCFGKRLG